MKMKDKWRWSKVSSCLCRNRNKTTKFNLFSEVNVQNLLSVHGIANKQTNTDTFITKFNQVQRSASYSNVSGFKFRQLPLTVNVNFYNSCMPVKNCTGLFLVWGPGGHMTEPSLDLIGIRKAFFPTPDCTLIPPTDRWTGSLRRTITLQSKYLNPFIRLCPQDVRNP